MALIEDLLDLLVPRRRLKRMRQAVEDVSRMRYKYAISNLDRRSRPYPASLAYVAPFSDLDLATMCECKQFAKHVGMTSYYDFAAVP